MPKPVINECLIVTEGTKKKDLQKGFVFKEKKISKYN